MIEFKDATLFSLLPDNLKNEETAALSAALQRGLLLIRQYISALSVYAAVHELPDDILNLLAVELRAQYYDLSDSREVREGIIQKTIDWYLRGGTVSVLEEYLATLYQGGRVEEWFNYGGEPYYFKAIIDLDLSDEIMVGDGNKIVQRILAYKNVRSWLEALSFHIGVEYDVPVSWRNSIVFQTEFYPRYNLGYLHLDGLWKLDGTRLLNGYDTDDILDFYPVYFCAGMGAPLILRTDEKILITGNVDTDVESKEKMRLRSSVLMDIQAEEKLCFRAGAGLQMGTRSFVTQQNRLDASWKLDGSRRLDGGLSEL